MDLREEFNKVKAEALAVVTDAKTAGRDLTAEERENNDRRFARLDEIKGILAAEKKAASYELDADTAVEQFAKAAHAPKAQLEVKPTSDNAARHREELNAWIRGDRQNFTLISTSGSNAMLPTSVAKPVEVKRMTNAVLAAIASRGFQVISTPGTDTISVPLFDDSANEAANTAENASAEVNQDPSVSGLSLGATLYDSKAVWYSNTLLLAPGYDLLGYVEPMLQKRIDRKQQSVWTTSLAAGTVGKTTATTTGVTYAELLAWEHSVPVAYRGDLVYMISDGLFQAIRGLVDGNSRPIYQESLRDSEPDKLFGKPVFVNDSLATPGAGAVSGIAASAERLFVRICNNRRLAKYVNIPGRPDQFGMELFVNAGFAFDTNAVKTLKHAAS